jgi:phosphatidylinositol 4-kinase A
VKSRDQLGKAGSKTLLQYFTSRFGHPGSRGFQQAQLAFTSSLAAYAIICYLMSIKDRHNGNVLIDRLGNLCHIDYGFILGISPGGNLGFESAAFKLSAEMLELMDGVDSPVFLQFTDTVIRGFLVARRLQAPLLSTISAFADSGLPCFMHKDDNLVSLRDKFLPDKRDSEASEHMKKLIYDAANKWTTKAYDGIQKLQNNIYSEYWK